MQELAHFTGYKQLKVITTKGHYNISSNSIFDNFLYFFGL